MAASDAERVDGGVAAAGDCGLGVVGEELFSPGRTRVRPCRRDARPFRLHGKGPGVPEPQM